ncbi:hypothetical protein AQUCO_00700015v1 [Aquilegia coerulea]|uniref:F-box domain-containing protein n=1 Tax=Aquilegia coerulea TaxID=218851 RepID=A0A2G5EI79_AQUCA|nr:hypothetical protein AQUCO_00700015v1 [Aquilegia coerulea]
MGKVCPKEKVKVSRRNRKQKRQLNARKEYLKPGALAHQLRYGRTICAKSPSSCTDLAKKRIVVLDSPKDDVVLDQSPSPLLSPLRTTSGPLDMIVATPKTPQLQFQDSESRLESLPMDLLVKILCHLHHDQLRPVFHVSQKIRKAVIIARQFHFNYTTPDRDRQELLRTITPRPTEHWPFVSKKDPKGIWCASPHTPKAPKQGPRPPARFKGNIEVRQITAALFQESVITSSLIPPGLPKSVCKSFASNRALFCEEELCQAVAQNKLR